MFNMKNSNVLAKSRGVLLFAFNTDTVDYVKIAEHAARLIQYNLNLPVTLVTDRSIVSAHFDRVIITENTLKNKRLGVAHGTQWRNGNRYQAYELSPYDETLLLDSDYLQLDSNLLKILDTVDDYVLVTDNQLPVTALDTSMNPLGMKFVWATAIAFKKTEKSQLLFDLVGRIQRNYSYYQKLYQIRLSNFRNDFAFTIADNIINGYTTSPGIPWTMLTFDKPITNIEINPNSLVVRELEQAHVIPKQSIHIMDKEYLSSNKFTEFVDAVCQN